MKPFSDTSLPGVALHLWLQMVEGLGLRVGENLLRALQRAACVICRNSSSELEVGL